MQPIQAIICFNGGSAGDLIKKLSLLCYDVDLGIVQEDGLVKLPQYFKNFFTNVWKENSDINKIDWNQVSVIENSHYYLDCFREISQRLYFIDYKDNITTTILSEFIRKRNNNTLENFVAQHIHSLPAELQSKVNVTNCIKIFEIQWLKNIKSWRANPNLTAIDFYDILKRDTALKVVENITGNKIKDIDKFDSIYSYWAERNSTFIQLAG